MKFADFISPEAIRAALTAVDKKGVIREMVQALLDAGKIKPGGVEGIIQAVLNREELGTTGIGRGVAIPHAKHPSVEELVGTVAVSREGVDFASLDGEKVYVFVFLVCPSDRPGDHLLPLAHTAQRLKSETFCKFLKQARTAEEIRQLLDEADSNQFRS